MFILFSTCALELAIGYYKTFLMGLGLFFSRAQTFFRMRSRVIPFTGCAVIITTLPIVNKGINSGC